MASTTHLLADVHYTEAESLHYASIMYANRIETIRDLLKEVGLGRWDLDMPSVPNNQIRRKNWRKRTVEDLRNEHNRWQECAMVWTDLFCKWIQTQKMEDLSKDTRAWYKTIRIRGKRI